MHLGNPQDSRPPYVKHTRFPLWSPVRLQTDVAHPNPYSIGPTNLRSCNPAILRSGASLRRSAVVGVQNPNMACQWKIRNTNEVAMATLLAYLLKQARSGLFSQLRPPRVAIYEARACMLPSVPDRLRVPEWRSAPKLGEVRCVRPRLCDTTYSIPPLPKRLLDTPFRGHMQWSCYDGPIVCGRRLFPVPPFTLDHATFGIRSMTPRRRRIAQNSRTAMTL